MTHANYTFIAKKDYVNGTSLIFLKTTSNKNHPKHKNDHGR